MKHIAQIAIGVCIGMLTFTYIQKTIYKTNIEKPKNKHIEKMTTEKEKINKFIHQFKMPEWCKDKSDERINRICKGILNKAYKEYGIK